MSGEIPALPYEEAQRLLAMSRAQATDELADDTKRMIRRNADSLDIERRDWEQLQEDAGRDRDDYDRRTLDDERHDWEQRQRDEDFFRDGQ